MHSSKHSPIKLKNMKAWPKLEPGDLVDIVAPSSGCGKKGLKKAIQFVSEMGLVPRYQEGIFGEDLLCASDDENRFQQFKRAVQSKDSKAIWCLRGGYGAAKLLPRLDKMKVPQSPKLLIGYSDITHLHSYFNYQWSWPSLHASMLEELGTGQSSRQEIKDLKKILFSKKQTLQYRNLKPLNEAARASGQIVAPLTGGNLTILLASLGTPWQAHAQGQILILEDIGERGYRVDRMLTQLQQAGYFNKIKGLIFGDFVGGEEKDCKYLWHEVQKRFAQSVKFPVLKNLPCGHSYKQRPIPLMTKSKLHLGARPVIEIETGVSSKGR